MLLVLINQSLCGYLIDAKNTFFSNFSTELKKKKKMYIGQITLHD